ncbi:MAG: succinate--CoA ligase subunit alpha [Candidatus Obscuribacter sp.]|jgi:succinyl-CoA synthetase alpha subunit|nr:succinate--CoA ligase subunit alpha [Candidatus Obscuribacter sp.]MDQ5966638.1 succinyl-CoA synthetase alpha subunit [Cyanobacteriota bacterium erpe_2018_sw_39hr_WHONDRS-SW48-000098_B_bin.30]MBK9618458.1 succinate--CoA ligase subunit alpha [Candidatus Obscuribacter sp.]MBK9772260.1 succinate--CoA ligase subunit alpha [Candidatus Obscuribacter sp.]MBL0188455.1 succinate--CoA ligase subunit alpha [Candidatus Obscuribacter sp.]
MILVDKSTKVVVQGATGKMGGAHTKRMIDYGTNIVGGVTPGKGGETVHGVPVFDTVMQAVQKTGATCSVIFVPPYLALDAGYEALDAGIQLLVLITEGIPPLDTAKLAAAVKAKGAKLIGPNCPGIITPGQSLIGILPGSIFKSGPVGMVSKSGTLTYEIALALTESGFGQSTCVGTGGDPVKGLDYKEVLSMFEADPATEVIVMIGEIGGNAEEEAAAYIKQNIKKPVIGYIAGQTAPPGKRMGHAGAIISGGKGTAESKLEAFKANGVKVAMTPSEVAKQVAASLKTPAKA